MGTTLWSLMTGAKISIKVKVTERIIPGVVSLGQGAWYSPDKKGYRQMRMRERSLKR